MIPNLIKLAKSHPYCVLPPGIHRATLAEIEKRFAITPYRMRLFRGFCLACELLVVAGCKSIYLDGSFTTSKVHPEDFDACWDLEGVDLSKVDATLLNVASPRTAQKQKFGGEFLIIDVNPSSVGAILDFFQTDCETGERKGILLLDSNSVKSYMEGMDDQE